MTTVGLPQFIDTADQRYFLESLDGGTRIGKYLRRFPDTVYSKAPDSHLVRLLYALVGPAGVGWLKQNLAEARLLLEAHGAALNVLDTIYGVPFSFPRLPLEIYDDDISGLLLSSLWKAIRAQDEAYRSRALKFFQGVRFGGTVQGLSLVASAGTSEPIAIIENYRSLFDLHSDDPLGIPWLGTTTTLEEFILLPRPTTSQSEEQLIRFDLVVPDGPYTLSFNGASATFPPGTTAGALQSALSAFATIGTGNVIVSGGPFPAAFAVLFTGALSNQPLPLLKVSFDAVQFTATGIQGSFLLTGAMAVTGIPEVGQTIMGPGIPANTVLEEISGTTWLLSNAFTAAGTNYPSLTTLPSLTNYPGFTSDPQNFTAVSYVPITVKTGVVDPSIEAVVLGPSERHGIQNAVDLLRPVPTYPSWGTATGTLRPQAWNSILASTEYTEVIRFVTGSTKVSWPATDGMHWIEPSVENEAPQLTAAEQEHYVNFHNVAGIKAYTDAALADPNYVSDASIVDNYNSAHVGPFPEMAAVMPFFTQFVTDYSTVFGATQSLAAFPDQLRVTNQTDSGLAVINRTYPADYSDLQGVPRLSDLASRFWSSLERANGADVLEIDLGVPQAVNFISLEVSRKPVSIAIDYDLVDQSPRRIFSPITMIPGFAASTSVYFDPSQQSPWEHLTYYFNDGLGMIFTRFIRLTFTRLAASGVFGRFLFDQATQTQVPWSIDVRNLRIGRNVAPSVAG